MKNRWLIKEAPFKSDQQMQWMFENKPSTARDWVDEAKSQGKDPVQPDKKKEDDEDEDDQKDKKSWRIK